ncbi:hypothetical protein QQ045_007673 [Rhodiola kirilowii]
MSSNWSMSEDVQLCISYCRQSVYPISGIRQKVDKLWEKIHLDFHDSWLLGGNQPRAEARSQDALASRFAKLKPMLVFWGSCLSYAERNKESGCNMQDKLHRRFILSGETTRSKSGQGGKEKRKICRD